MATKKISLNSSATADEVFHVVRPTVEERHYVWEQTDRASALAHEGGRLIKDKSVATKLLLSLEVDGGKLVLQSRTHGGFGYVVNMGPAYSIRINVEFTKVRKAIKGALAGAGLT